MPDNAVVVGVAAASAFAAGVLMWHRLKKTSCVGLYLRQIAPALDGQGHKGQAGRIGVLGGSVDYAGAPYYAGMSALRVGAELLYMCTAQEACGPIKGYSPELMVSGVYRHSHISDPSTADEEKKNMVEAMKAKLGRFHALAVGPGLGRHPEVLDAVASVIEAARESELPLVIDADGLWLITERPELVKNYKNAVLTPNKHEYGNLAENVLGDRNGQVSDLCAKLGGPIILKKGAVRNRSKDSV